MAASIDDFKKARDAADTAARSNGGKRDVALDSRRESVRAQLIGDMESNDVIVPGWLKA